jgi:hypothetical protein
MLHIAILNSEQVSALAVVKAQFFAPHPDGVFEISFKPGADLYDTLREFRRFEIVSLRIILVVKYLYVVFKPYCLIHQYKSLVGCVVPLDSF